MMIPYFLVLFVLAAYGFHRYWLVYDYYAYSKNVPGPPPEVKNWPRVTVQLPIFNERYVIEREIGAGGMAVVYLARDKKLDREAALKVLRPELGAVLGSERILAEIKISARLDHPHILTLIDSGTADGLLYYVLPTLNP